MSEELLGDIYSTLALVAQGCQEDLAIGEAALEFVVDNMRIMVALTDSLDMQQSNFSVPLSSYETLAGVNTPTLRLTDVSDVSASSSSVGVMFLQYTSNPDNLRSNASIVNIEATRYTTVSSGRLRRRLMEDRLGLPPVGYKASPVKKVDDPWFAGKRGPLAKNRRVLATDYLEVLIDVELHNTAEITYEAPPVIQSVVKCEVDTQEAIDVARGKYAAIPKTVTGTCANVGYQFSIECPGIRGTFNNTCPSYEKVPVCTTYDGTNFVDAGECTVLEHDGFSTTCRCGAIPEPTAAPTFANASSNSTSSAVTRRYRSLTLSESLADEEDVSTESMRERIRRHLSTSSFSVQITSTYSIIGSPFIQNFTAAPDLVVVEPDSFIFEFLLAILVVFVSGLVVFSVWDFREAAWERANANRKPLKVKKSTLFETDEDKKKRLNVEEEERKRQDEEYEKKYGADGLAVQSAQAHDELNGTVKSMEKTKAGASEQSWDGKPASSPRSSPNKIAPSAGDGPDDLDRPIFSPERTKPSEDAGDGNDEIADRHFGEDIDDIEHTHHRSIKGFYNTILPEEFEDGKWFDMYVNRILLEHPWLCIFAPYKKGRDLRTVKFSIAMCNLIAFLFTTTVLAWIFFRDDGSCESISVQSECIARQSFQGVRDLCSYNLDNDYCMFITPLTDFYTILIYTLVATSLALPLRKIMEYMIIVITKRYPKKDKKKDKQKGKDKPAIKGVVPVNNETEEGKHYHDQDLDKTMEDLLHAEDWEHHLESDIKTDEFKDVQRLQGTLMRAARLDKAQKSMDFVLPLEETALVMLQADADTQRFRNHMIFKNRVDNFSFRIMRYGFTKPKTRDIQRKLVRAREYADYKK